MHLVISSLAVHANSRCAINNLVVLALIAETVPQEPPRNFLLLNSSTTSAAIFSTRDSRAAVSLTLVWNKDRSVRMETRRLINLEGNSLRRVPAESRRNRDDKRRLISG